MSAQFSRMPPDSYQFEAKLFENEDFVAVVYSVIPPHGTLINQPTKYILATYDKTSEKIDAFDRQISEMVLVRNNRYMTIGTVQSNLKVVVKTYKKELEEQPFETIVYQISKKGKIEKENPDLEMEQKEQVKKDTGVNS